MNERYIVLKTTNPEGNQWKTEMREIERNLARTHQVHVCKTLTCLCKNSYGDMVCK
jgi:hypothetical protein